MGGARYRNVKVGSSDKIMKKKFVAPNRTALLESKR